VREFLSVRLSILGESRREAVEGEGCREDRGKEGREGIPTVEGS